MITPDLGRPSGDVEPAPADGQVADEQVADELAVQQDVSGPPPGRTDPTPDGCGLRFSRPGGPLVVICGLHGGAGTSTLAYALAAQAAQESPADVLLCETDAAAGDVAALTGVTSPLSLSEIG